MNTFPTDEYKTIIKLFSFRKMGSFYKKEDRTEKERSSDQTNNRSKLKLNFPKKFGK